MNGTDLLAEFRATRAEAAFGELVRRHTNFVYSIAKRRVADMTLAQDVTQLWSALCPIESDTREYRRLVEQMEGKPFVLLGIHADDHPEKAKAAAEEYQMSWPSFQDAREGPISKTYNINSWPTIYVLDCTGVIRYRGLHFRSEIAAAAEKLLQE